MLKLNLVTLVAEAHANLIVWAAVIELLDSNLVTTSSPSATNRVIKIAKTEQQKYLKQYDHYEAKITSLMKE